MYLRGKKRVVNNITVSGIEIEVSRKAIKNLYVKVSRRTGKVRVSCPKTISEQELLRFLISRMDWIKKKQKEAEKVLEPEDYDFVNGEKHYFMGRELELKVIERKQFPVVAVIEDLIELTVRPGTSKEKRKAILETHYRQYLKETLPGMVTKWERKMKVKVNEFRVKKMKTRWGTCNTRDKRIWLSLELAKKSPGCLESVVVHEMVHLLERLHNKRFYRLMDTFFPEWRKFEGELKSVID